MTRKPITVLLRETLPNRAVASLTLMLAHVALAVASTFPGDEPDWVRKHPVIQGYYVGIGMARKVRTTAESAEAAKNVARNDIAGQISVSISSDVLRTILEENEKVREEFTSSIRASATADLENLELVDTYESDEEYWVYLRLSKADFQARRAAKLEAAAGQALDLYAKGRESERAQDVATAIGLYARAFAPVEKYLAEPLTLDDGGRQVYLLNEMYGSLRSLLEKIELKPVDAERLSDFAGGSTERYNEIVALYLKQTAQQLDDLMQAHQDGQADRAAKLAHSAAGASATCGMMAVVPLLRQIELAGHRGDLDTIGHLLPPTRQEFHRIQQYLAAHPFPQSAQESTASAL